MQRAPLVLVLALAAAALEGQQAPPALDAERRAAIVHRLAETLEEFYVFPDVARQMDVHVHQRLEEGAYDGIDSLPAFAERLTEDLRSISRDLHLRVMPLPPGDASGDEAVDDAERRRRFTAELRADNFGFHRVERLPGNVGYLDLRGFSPAEVAGKTAVAAMRFLAEADALIVDLRRNGGGSPSMIQLISSYFFAESVHLNSFYIRRDDSTRQFWTHDHVDGERMADVPIWVLTSSRTFSAAEEFTYNLKHLERATIVGETTGGGAHPIDFHRFPELGVQATVPFGRAVNPVTGTNWEGTGVTPHVAVPAAAALDTAHARALERLSGTVSEPGRRLEIAWALEAVAARLEPLTLEPAQLAAYAGHYGPREIRLEDGQLIYQRDERPAFRLVPIGEDRFALDGLDDFRIRFDRDEAGAVVALVGLYDSGREEPSPRSGD